MVVRKLRLKKGWSQEHLAQVTGLNVRTIQRIEHGQAPSLESKRSLAAVFEVDIASFDSAVQESDTNVATTTLTNKEAEMQNQTNPTESISSEEKYALNYAKGVKEFYDHLIIYCVFAVVFTVVKGFDDPIVLWGLLGWSIGVAVHGLNAFEKITFLNSNWERKLAEKKLGRKL